jgi:light-regulated signal transduction histidine kinase (bacteriophytochrome)
MQPTGMNTLIMHVRVRLQHTLDAKRVDLRVDKLPIVVCDETAMAEVFHNLITNAVKYNDKSLPVIEIGCTERLNPDTQQPEHEFFVRDNGMGIKKEYFDKIFQVFQRLQRDEEGTGIGLTIVRRVIEWHGGRIWLESEEGKGTTFYFTIPKREFTKTGTVLDSTVTIPKGTPNLATPV